MEIEHTSEAASGAVATLMKTAAPAATGTGVTVSTLTLAGVPMSEWVYVVTLIWLAMQILGWCWDRVKKARAA